MTIAAITEKYTKEQLAGIFPGKDIEWVLMREVAVAPDAVAYFDLDFVEDHHRCEALSRLQPALVIVNAVTPTIGDIGFPFVRINAWPGFLERSIHELAVPDETKVDGGGPGEVDGGRPGEVDDGRWGEIDGSRPGEVDDGRRGESGSAEWASKVAELYRQLGRDYKLVPDVPGMISARILATIINEAWFTWEEKVSTKDEIDTAMKLGTNYPLGPFEWGERIGLGQVARLLWSLSKTAPEYTPSAALMRAADGLKYD